MRNNLITKITHDKARDLFPGAVETWIILCLEQFPRDFADEREVLKNVILWVVKDPNSWDDSGTLTLQWGQKGVSNPILTRWSKKKLEWADEPDEIDLASLSELE
jgi:hypothetical protein